MKNSPLFFCIIVLSMNSCFGQTKKDSYFIKLARETNRYMDYYNEINPYDHSYLPIKEFGLSQEEIESIIEGYTKDEMSENKDSVDPLILTEYFQEKIMSNLYKIVNHKAFKLYDVTKLLEPGIGVVRSDDHKLYNFSFDEKTGGTYRSRLSMMYYTEFDSVKVDPDDIMNKELLEPYSVFSGDGFDQIYSIPTKEGVKYVLIGSVRGCSYCFRSFIMLVKLEDRKFVQDFLYSVELRTWEESLKYDHIRKVITSDYVTDDLTPDCNCTGIVDAVPHYEEKTTERKKCTCVFTFNGLNFELLKATSRIIKE